MDQAAADSVRSVLSVTGKINLWDEAEFCILSDTRCRFHNDTRTRALNRIAAGE
jgi:hypothetical protein